MNPLRGRLRLTIAVGVAGILLVLCLLALLPVWLVLPEKWLTVWLTVICTIFATGFFVSFYFSILVDRVIARIRTIGEIASAIDPVHPGVRIPEENLPGAIQSVVRGLNDSWERLEEAFTQQARFTADASHELRTPLAVIRTQVEHTLSRERSSNNYRDTLVIVQESVLRLEEILETLLMLTRAESRAISAEFRTIDLFLCAKEVGVSLAQEVQKHHAALHFVEPPFEVKIRGDIVLIERILSNVLSNSLKHGIDETTEEGQRIDISVAEEGAFGVLRIRDHGKGIAPNHRSRVFERFFKGERQPGRMKRKGAGLGLALAQSLAELHKGRVLLEEVKGKGACFRIELPKWVANPAKLDLPIESTRGSTPIWPA